MTKIKAQLFKKIKFEYRIGIIYFIIGFLWIFFSDTFFGSIISDKQTLIEINIFKGFFYVLITSILLYYLVKRHIDRLHKAEFLINHRSEELEIQNKKYKELNEDLKKAKIQAEESDRLKSAFLANMSHEIRTPMNGILGFATLLKEPDLTGLEQQNFVKIIEKSGVRMLNIINDIIEISKIESGVMLVNLKKSDINKQIEFVYTFLYPEAEKKKIRFSFKNSLPAHKSIIKTDSDKLFAILINLVKNAIKYTNKGSIEFGYTLKTKAESAELVSEPVELEFFVKDTGIGIPEERQNAIFERFIQADIEDKMAQQGAGLGLAISKFYAEMLGGKIWVESEEENLSAGKTGGTTFFFTIPYIPQTDDKNRIDKINTTDDIENKIDNKISGLKILIVEDDEISEFLISRIVEAHSKEIITVRTGLEAVEVCRKNPDIDLILMDIRMPEMNGYEATREIRQFNKDVIIIAQTAYSLLGDSIKAKEIGCDDYISKPIIKDDLMKLLQKYFN